MIRTVYVPALDRDVSALGFGCASLGSRISERQGRMALERAFHAGVTWYDIAPSYGDGRAESLLGEFLTSHRGDVVVATKVGILPPRPSVADRIIKPFIRTLTSAVPQVRKLVAALRPSAIKLPITSAVIQQSIEASLKRLHTDRVDILALHDPSMAEVVDPDVLRALQKVLEKGQALALSVAGSYEVVQHAHRSSDLFRIAQVGNDPFSRNIERLGASAVTDDRTSVGFGLFGHDGAFEKLLACLQGDANLAEEFIKAGYLQKSLYEVARAYLLEYAFASNKNGVVLASMYGAGHLDLNVSYAAKAIAPRALKLADRLASNGRPL